MKKFSAKRNKYFLLIPFMASCNQVANNIQNVNDTVQSDGAASLNDNQTLSIVKNDSDSAKEAKFWEKYDKGSKSYSQQGVKKTMDVSYLKYPYDVLKQYWQSLKHKNSNKDCASQEREILIAKLAKKYPSHIGGLFAYALLEDSSSCFSIELASLLVHHIPVTDINQRYTFCDGNLTMKKHENAPLFHIAVCDLHKRHPYNGYVEKDKYRDTQSKSVSLVTNLLKKQPDVFTHYKCIGSDRQKSTMEYMLKQRSNPIFSNILNASYEFCKNQWDESIIDKKDELGILKNILFYGNANSLFIYKAYRSLNDIDQENGESPIDTALSGLLSNNLESWDKSRLELLTKILTDPDFTRNKEFVNLVDKNGCTPIMRVLSVYVNPLSSCRVKDFGEMEEYFHQILELLIKHGANVNHRDQNGQSFLDNFLKKDSKLYQHLIHKFECGQLYRILNLILHNMDAHNLNQKDRDNKDIGHYIKDLISDADLRRNSKSAYIKFYEMWQAAGGESTDQIDDIVKKIKKECEESKDLDEYKDAFGQALIEEFPRFLENNKITTTMKEQVKEALDKFSLEFEKKYRLEKKGN